MSRVGETQLNNFGSKMIITKYRKYNDIDIYFPEYNWTAEHVQYGQFKNGSAKCPYERRTYGIGYLGEGPYSSRENEKNAKAYITWNHMLKRCYDPKFHEKEPTYISCTVCEEWLSFQNFAQWFEENYYEIPGQRIALDKDILVKGNKVYSPETCCFVPQSINSLFTKCDNARGDLPVGVYYDKQSKKYKAQCRTGTGKTKNLGYYNAPEEAFNAYKEFKEALINKIANNYIEDIPFELYRAMINYEVDIDD